MKTEAQHEVLWGVAAAVAVALFVALAMWIVQRQFHEPVDEITGVVESVEYLPKGAFGGADSTSIITFDDGRSIEIRGIAAIDRKRFVRLQLNRRGGVIREAGE